jgi:hypothetical protein
MEEMEVVVRVGFVDDRVGGALVVVGAPAVGRLCLELRGVRLAPSEMDARGRDAEELTELAGDTTDWRVAFVEDGGLAAAEADEDSLGGFVFDGAEDFGGTRDCLRLGGPAEGAGVRLAIEGLEGELVDFLSGGAVTGTFAVAVFVVVDGFTGDDFAVPAPNVPELRTCSGVSRRSLHQHHEH